MATTTSIRCKTCGTSDPGDFRFPATDYCVGCWDSEKGVPVQIEIHGPLESDEARCQTCFDVCLAGHTNDDGDCSDCAD